MSSVSIRRAVPSQVSVIRKLLESCDLPAQDIEAHVEHFLVATVDDVLAGVVGLEVRDSGGLLRSLAVEPAYRGTGLGNALTREILKHARLLGISDVGLLTTTAKNFFAKAGFSRINGSAVPAFVSESGEYRLYCPSTAICMVRRLQ